MFKNLLQFYSLAVCFVSSLAMMITLIIASGSITDFFLTEYKYKPVLSNFNTNDKYINYKKSICLQDNTNFSDKLERLTPQELTLKRLEDREEYITNKKSHAVADLISYAGGFIVEIMFFIIHWLLYKRVSLK